METASDQTREVRRTIRDLVALSALPAIWVGYQPHQVAESLADVLLNTLPLEFVYLRLRGLADGREIEVARTGRRPTTGGQTQVIRRAVAPWLDQATVDLPQAMPSPMGGGTARIVRVPIGWEGDDLLIAGSLQADFPTEEEHLLLSVAANQAAMVFLHLRAEQGLRESEQRWRSLTEALPQLVWTATPDGACDYFSTQWTQHTGVPGSDLVGRGWLEVLHPDDREATRQQWTAAVKRSGTYDVEYRVRRFDGEYRWFKTRGVPIRDGGGGIFKWFGTCTDITEAKLTAEELRLAKEAAESANRAKDEFLANVSHEIRTPMNAILGLTTLVLGTRLDDGQRQSLATVNSAANNLLGIINDLLDFSKIEAGKLELDRDEFSLRAALGDTLRALAMRAHQKGLELASNVKPEVPDALIGDAGRLRQVLINIVGNAIKFTDKGEVLVQVSSVSDAPSTKDELRLLFTVRDTGIGIPREKHAAIFRAFEQEDSSTTRKYGGTGLGLTIAAQLAALMGGKITVESQPGQGSTFSITAQFGRSAKAAATTRANGSAEVIRDVLSHTTADDLPTATAGSTAESEPALSAPAVPLHILVADDNEFNVTLLKLLFGQKGHRHRIAGDGREALALAMGGEFDLLLLDVHLPEMDGFAVAQAIRERERGSGKHLPIIAFTARSGKQDRERCLAAGMDDFLSKPVQTDELWAVIDRVVAAHAQKDHRDTRLLDPTAIMRVCGGEPAIFEKICQAFQTSAPNQMARVRSAFRDKDAPRLREAAHTLSSTLAAFSTTAGTAASSLEDEAARGRIQQCIPLVERLESMCDDLLDQTRRLSIERLSR